MGVEVSAAQRAEAKVSPPTLLSTTLG